MTKNYCVHEIFQDKKHHSKVEQLQMVKQVEDLIKTKATHFQFFLFRVNFALILSFIDLATHQTLLETSWECIKYNL